VLRCDACGHENPDDSRFCGRCAAPLAPSSSAGDVRKNVTILFCDLVGSTELGDRFDPEQLQRITRRYYDAMRAPIEKHGGTLEKFIGDAVMAVFGVPQLHEDDALRAVRAAAEMFDVLDGLNTALEQEHAVTLSCRIGINTGEVLASSVDSVVVSDAVNVAARLEQAAGPGEILVGESTYRLVRQAVTAEPVEALSLKGKAAPVTAYRIVEVTSGAPGFARHLDAPIVGRERELALLRNAFDRTVTDRSCQLFTALGVGGVGKSRLIAAFLDEVRERAQILRGRCLPYGEGITFYPLAEALIDLAGLSGTDTPDAARAKLAALAGDDDEATRVGELVGQAIGIPGGEAAPVETLWAIRRLLEQLAADRPLVFMIDDLQWAEPRFVELVEHVSDFSEDSPILLACMARPELLDQQPGWGGGKLNVTTILLEPLDPQACRALVANLLADPVDADACERVVEAAGGNPLYAEEITGLMVDEGRLILKGGTWVATDGSADAPIPPTISALLAARLDSLPVEQRRLLDVASVMGQVFYPAAVRAIAPRVDGEMEPQLRGLVRQQFIRPERSDIPQTEALAFRHLLIRDAAYEGLPKAERADLHERLAGWLDEASGTLGERDEIVGYHLEQAFLYRKELGVADERERLLADAAGRRLAAAGAASLARGDRWATVNLLTRACSMLPADDPLRLYSLLDLGAAIIDTGSFDEGRTLFDEVESIAVADGDERLRMHTLIQRFDSLGFGNEADGLRVLAEEALAVFEPAGDERGQSRALRLIADIAFEQGQVAEAERLLDLALVRANNAGIAVELQAAYHNLGIVLTRSSSPISSCIQRCRDVLARTEGNRTIAAEMFHALAHMGARQGAFDEALANADRCLSTYRENGLMWSRAFFTEIVWDVRMLAAEPAAALDALSEGVAALDEMGEPATLLHAFLAMSLYELERFDEAEPLAKESADSVQSDWRGHIGMAVYAKVLARKGHLDEAESMARTAADFFEGSENSIDRPSVLLDLAEVLRIAGRPQEAVPVARQALSLYDLRGDVVSAARSRGLIDQLQ
jgi:class 3 adenylate cyclase/tetratricopeptide (TPR) repeat protein